MYVINFNGSCGKYCMTASKRFSKYNVGTAVLCIIPNILAVSLDKI